MKPRLLLFTIVSVALFFSGGAAVQAGQVKMDGTSAEMWGTGGAKTNLVRGAWLKDSRFAMFIHWGLYSELGGKWKEKTYYGIAEWIMKRGKIPVGEYEQVANR